MHMQTAPPHYLSMSLCHMECPSKMTNCMPGLPTQVYPGPPTFEGILEVRKEKSRDAARSRRGKENYEFYELAKMLPLPGAITSQLDKASIIRLTISYLKLRDFSCHGDPPWNREIPMTNKHHKGNPGRRRSLNTTVTDIFEAHQGTHILQSLDGFAFALSNDARFLYISETVSIYLGLSQVEMTGSSIFDYIHHDDHAELAEQLGLVLPHGGTAMPSPGSISDDSSTNTPRSISPPIHERAAIMNPNPSRGYGRSFCIRMKSTLTKRGVHVKCSGYRVVHVLCHMRPQFSFTLTRKHPPPLLGLVAMAIALPPPTINELLIDNDMFVTRLSPEFKIIYCEPRISDVMDLTAEEITNKNLYDYCHAQDLQNLRKSHVDLLTKGQVLTDYYRLMNKHGGYIWVQTCATTICNVKNVEDQNIICINYILSGIEYAGCVMDTRQMSMSSSTEPDQSDHSESEAGSDKDDKKEDRDGHSSADTSHKTDGRGQKRKAMSQDPSITNQDMTDLDAGSPSNPLAMLYQASEDGLYDDAKYNGDKCRLDTKNSRRKMERPRKRRRESGSDDEQNPNIDNDNDLLLEHILPGDNGETDHDTNPPVTQNGCSGMGASPKDIVGKIRSPIPEDLSVKAVSSGSLHNTSAILNGTDNSDKWATSSAAYTDVTTTTSSVRDLEEVMNKHLPAVPADADIRSGFHGDYAASQGVLGFAKHKSTIQWIGSGHSPGMGTEGHPATTLLRSLYANRESVIRTNVYTPRPQYYGDVQPSLLTPPGGSTDASPFTAPQAKTPPSTYGLLPGYPTNAVSSLPETYGITPPASVSPQDKYAAQYAEQCHEAALRSYAPDTSHPVPIKPQAYPLPAHASASIYERSAAQYASYYSPGFSPYTHSSSPAPAHYREGTKTGTW